MPLVFLFLFLLHLMPGFKVAHSKYSQQKLVGTFKKTCERECQICCEELIFADFDDVQLQDQMKVATAISHEQYIFFPFYSS
jgi:hypothetical protein